MAFEAVIKYLLEVFISDKSPFSVGSDFICVKLPGNEVDTSSMVLNGINTSYVYGAKWNKYLVRILQDPSQPFLTNLMHQQPYGSLSFWSIMTIRVCYFLGARCDNLQMPIIKINVLFFCYSS